MLSRWHVLFLAACLISACDTVGQYGETEYYWRMTEATREQAFNDIIFCMDSADAAFQRYNANQQPIPPTNNAAAVGSILAHFATTNAAGSHATSAYDNCMLGRGYQSWTLTSAQWKRVDEIRTNVERAEILSVLMSSPPHSSMTLYPVEKTKVSATALPLRPKDN